MKIIVLDKIGYGKTVNKTANLYLECMDYIGIKYSQHLITIDDRMVGRKIIVHDEDSLNLNIDTYRKIGTLINDYSNYINKNKYRTKLLKLINKLIKTLIWVTISENYYSFLKQSNMTIPQIIVFFVEGVMQYKIEQSNIIISEINKVTKFI